MATEYPDLPRSEVLPLIPKGSRRLLDVGCGRGGFGEALKRQLPAIEVWGVEEDVAAASEADARLDMVFCGRFPEALDRSAVFDVLTFLDVLEHMEDPWSVLEGSRRLLADDGVVVASLPNVRHHSVSLNLLLRGEWAYGAEGILDRTHLRFFTKRSMVRLFQDTGYEVSLLHPLNASRDRLRRLIPFTEQLLTIQYGVVARPR